MAKPQAQASLPGPVSASSQWARPSVADVIVTRERLMHVVAELARKVNREAARTVTVFAS
jgi:hypothetical protein